MKRSSHPSDGNANSKQSVSVSGGGAMRTPEISPEQLEERLLDILPDGRRLEALRQTELIDTPAEETFDRFTRLASQILDVPVTLISLIDDKRHYFKSDVGLPEPYASTRERPLAKSFCQYTIALGHPLVIEDAREHPLICDNPVTDEYGIGGYVGVPLITEEGHGIGNFCALDREPRQWTEDQLQALEDLAASVMTVIEFRAQNPTPATEENGQPVGHHPDGTTNGRSASGTLKEDSSSPKISSSSGGARGRTELQFRHLLDKLPAGAYMCDQEGLITYYNKRVVEVWGREPELNDPIDRFCGSYQLLLPDGTPIDHEACWMALTLENDREYQEEIIIERPDGSRVFAVAHSMPLHDASGTLIGALNVVTDISERKRAEQVLRESKDRMAAKAADMERLHDLSTRLLRQDDIEAALREVMEASAELLQADRASVQIYDDEEEVLRLVDTLEFDEAFDDQFRVVKTDSITTCAAALGRRDHVLVEDLSTAPEFAEFYRAAKRYEVEAAFSTPLYGSGDELLGMFTMYWDEPHRPAANEFKLLDLYTQQAARQIERKRAERRLKKAKEEAEKTARLRSNLLANVSHEIRTPITGILGLTEGLEEKVAEERREEVRLIERSGRRLMDTLNSVLALAQLEGGEIELNPELLDVTTEVKAIARSFRHQAEEKGLSLEVTSSAPEALARLDPALLERILNNLLSNAVKFTGEGGVTVEVSGFEENVEISVSDTGVGISGEFQTRLFEEFTQESTGFSRAYEGVGLGLPLTKKMIEQMDGEISVESEKGKGSTFTVRFPRATSKNNTGEENPEAAGADPAKDGMEREKNAVLLIEDNEIIRRVIVDRLGDRHDYEVEAFEKAKPALQRAKEQAFDVVLIDISLPGIDGTEALQRLRATETYRDRPIIAVTGHALPGDRERFLEEGFSEHMGKPFSADDLAEKIRSLSEQ